MKIQKQSKNQKFNDDEITKIIKESYFEKTNVEIGEIVGLSDSSIKRRARKIGLPPKPKNFFNVGIEYDNLTAEEVIENKIKTKEAQLRRKDQQKELDLLVEKNKETKFYEVDYKGKFTIIYEEKYISADDDIVSEINIDKILAEYEERCKQANYYGVYAIVTDDIILNKLYDDETDKLLTNFEDITYEKLLEESEQRERSFLE